MSPPFTEKELPHASTRLTLRGFLCEQNETGRPKSKESKSSKGVGFKLKQRVKQLTNNLKQFSLNTKLKTNDNQFELRLRRVVVLFNSTHL